MHIFNKRGFSGVVALLSVTLLLSCEKFLEVKPTDALLADNAVSDAKTARALVNSGYTALKAYHIRSGLNLAILPGDNVFFAGSQSQHIELDNHAFTVTNSAIVSAYAANYTLINTANWAITEIPKVQDDAFLEGEQDKLVGEAYFFRASAYFNLVRSWGGVQLQLHPTTDLESLGDIPRSSAADTYAQIFSDLQLAESLLPTDEPVTRNKVQRTVVQAFRAKVALYAGDFETAEAMASTVIDQTGYKLLEDYSEFFQTPFLTAESIFELSATSTNPGTNPNLWLPASGTPRGSYEFRPTTEIVSLLNDPDKGGSRKDLLQTREDDVYVGLYHTVTPNINPAYLIRVADLYLIRAEARLRKASPDFVGAVADLNRVRARAGAALYPAGETDAGELLHAIWDERRLEFAFESDRWYDLVRTEQAGDVLGIDRDFWLFPIPQTDLLADPALNKTNNPGY